MSDDFDDAYLAAARRAAQLSTRGDTPRARAVPVRAVAPGRDFDLEPVGPGWLLYSTATIETQLEPVGICVEVIHGEWIDEETGEVLPRTRYRCLRRVQGSSSVYLDAADVDTKQLCGLDRVGAWTTALWLLKPLIVRKSWSRTPSAHEIEAVHDAWRLTAAVAL